MEKSRKLIYSVQEHHASHLHYDLRLEKGGVLKSWAMPKGIPVDESKHLAIETEDHQLEYAHFEGVIPEGMYGAGEVILWDYGYYTPLRWNEKRIEIEINGKKIKGVYVLLRIKGKDWLIFKKKTNQSN
ncbi:MAG: DNA polymerase ligase N-terminal domain-containing protein [Candidatus Micrarchaeia archaeon]